MKITGTFPKSAYTRLKRQSRIASPIFSSQQEIIIQAFTGAALETYLLTHLFAVQQISDSDRVLPYTTLEFVFTNIDSGLTDTGYAGHIVIPQADVQGEMAVHAAEQINAWARTQGIQNPNLLSVHATAEVVNFDWVIRIKLPWGMLGAVNAKEYLPITTGFSIYENYGFDHPFMVSVRAGKFGMAEISPYTPYRYYYPGGEAPYFYYQDP